MFSTRKGRYKYIWYYGPITDELYDLKSDPLEQHNLIGNKKYQKHFKEMHDRLFDWIEANGNIQIPLQRRRKGNKEKKRPKKAPKTVPDDIE